MSSRRRIRKFWKNVLTLFIVYMFIFAGLYLLFDFHAAVRHFRKDPGELVLMIMGAAFAAAFSMAYWMRRDPELRRW
jgi:drug/metabolite transporter (DMT)-like permease